MKITLCSSAIFFDRLYDAKDALEMRGHMVFMPSMQNFHHLNEARLAEVQHDLILEQFEKISKSDAIYVANYDKDGINGYIGGGVFLEMGKVFGCGVPIFLMNELPQHAAYKEELLAMQPVVVGKEWEKLENINQRTVRMGR